MKWIRRLAMIVFTIFWFSLLLFPVFAFRLATNNSITVGNRQVFMVTELGTAGIGYLSSKEASAPPDNLCRITNVRYYMWQGTAEPLERCNCDDGVAREPVRNQCVEP